MKQCKACDHKYDPSDKRAGSNLCPLCSLISRSWLGWGFSDDESGAFLFADGDRGCATEFGSEMNLDKPAPFLVVPITPGTPLHGCAMACAEDSEPVALH